MEKKPVAAPFPYIGGKSKACGPVWAALGDPPNYVEPFAGSLAMLLGRPSIGKTETVNDKDGFVANFWRAVSKDWEAVAHHVDWPVNECDLFARHSWLVRQSADLLDRLHGDPDYFDAKVAGWWCWGLCAWIGRDWCKGKGPWVHDGETLTKITGPRVNGVDRRLPHLGNAGQSVNRRLPVGVVSRTEFIREWFEALSERTRDVRVAAGDWQRVLTKSVTTLHGITGVFLDPPYTAGNVDYAAGGAGGHLASAVRAWCAANGGNKQMRIVICGHAGEHDALLDLGWFTRAWKARSGMASTDEAKARRLSETVWCSPHCVRVPAPASVVSSLFSAG